MNKTELNQYTRRFFSGTFLSRLSGMGRDLAMAFAFGDHPSVAAFMVAFRFSNLFRRLLGEGPFQSVFIPHYEEIRVKNLAEAGFFFRQLTLLLSALLLTIIFLSEALLTCLGHFCSFSENSQEILHLCRWMVPGLLFICLYGLNLSLLSCHHHFFTGSFAPFICNIVWASGALALQFVQTPQAMLTLAKVVTAGFALQWLFTLPLTLKVLRGLRASKLSLTFSPKIKQFARSLGYGVIGVGATQVNALLDSLFARAANVQGPVYLWYSIRIEQLVLAIFGIACVNTLVPALSRALKGGDLLKAKEVFTRSSRRILALMIPCSFALFSLGIASVNLLYGRGHFSEQAILQTSLCLFSYALGLVPTTFVILVSSVFYAEGDFKTPLKASLLTVLLNIGLNGLFVFGMGRGGEYSACYKLLLFFQLGFFAEENAQLFIRRCGKKSVTVLCLSFAAFLVALSVGFLLFRGSFFPRNFSGQLLQFGSLSGSFLLCLFFLAKLTKNEDLLEIFALFFTFRRDRGPAKV